MSSHSFIHRSEIYWVWWSSILIYQRRIITVPIYMFDDLWINGTIHFAVKKVDMQWEHADVVFMWSINLIYCIKYGKEHLHILTISFFNSSERYQNDKGSQSLFEFLSKIDIFSIKYKTANFQQFWLEILPCLSTDW